MYRRLYLDARGELDLRRMDSSSLAVVRLKTAPEQARHLARPGLLECF